MKRLFLLHYTYGTGSQCQTLFLELREIVFTEHSLTAFIPHTRPPGHPLFTAFNTQLRPGDLEGGTLGSLLGGKNRPCLRETHRKLLLKERRNTNTASPCSPLPFCSSQSCARARPELRTQSRGRRPGLSPNGAARRRGLAARPPADPPSRPAATTADATHRVPPPRIPPCRRRCGKPVPEPGRWRGRLHGVYGSFSAPTRAAEAPRVPIATPRTSATAAFPEVNKQPLGATEAERWGGRRGGRWGRGGGGLAPGARRGAGAGANAAGGAVEAARPLVARRGGAATPFSEDVEIQALRGPPKGSDRRHEYHLLSHSGCVTQANVDTQM